MVVSKLNKIIMYVQYLILSKFKILKGFQYKIINLPAIDIIQTEQTEIKYLLKETLYKLIFSKVPSIL